jgi:hypothetical protein
VTVASAFSAGVAVNQGISMRSHSDLTGLIKFLARDDWKSSLEEVMAEHFAPAMQEFDLEYEAIGAALGGSWDMTLWGVAFEDFLGRQFAPDGRNFVDEYLRRRGWNESAPTKTYMRGLRNSIMSLYEASAIVPGQSFLARDLLRGGAPVFNQRADRHANAQGMGSQRRAHCRAGPEAHSGRRCSRFYI